MHQHRYRLQMACQVRGGMDRQNMALGGFTPKQQHLPMVV
jgi:hypothetical protein